jgi:hypothetical protein
MYSQGFSIYRLQNLIRLGGKGSQVLELEDLYMNMLKKLESLAKQVFESSDVLFEKVGISSSNCGLVCCTFFPSLYLLFINVVAYCLHCVKAPKLT